MKAKDVWDHYTKFLFTATESKKDNLFGYSSHKLTEVCETFALGFANKGINLFYCSDTLNVRRWPIRGGPPLPRTHTHTDPISPARLAFSARSSTTRIRRSTSSGSNMPMPRRGRTTCQSTCTSQATGCTTLASAASARAVPGRATVAFARIASSCERRGSSAATRSAPCPPPPPPPPCRDPRFEDPLVANVDLRQPTVSASSSNQPFGALPKNPEGRRGFGVFGAEASGAVSLPY